MREMQISKCKRGNGRIVSLDLNMCTKRAFIAKYIDIKDTERRQRDEISTSIVLNLELLLDCSEQCRESL